MDLSGIPNGISTGRWTMSRAIRGGRPWAWFILAIGTILVSAYAHLQAGFTLPNPWNDEPWFLWSAISMAENGTYFSESLNPDRVVLMSILYQAPLALLFKLTGFSFSLARWVSWGYLMVSYAGILVLVSRRPFPLISAAVGSLFYLGASAVVAGNMCRPEAMVWAIVVWSFVAADRGHYWRAMALSGVAVLVHQVAIVFFAAHLWIYLVRMVESRKWIGPARGDGFVMAVAGGCLALYLSFLAVHFQTSLADLQEAAGEPFKQTLWERFFLSNKTPWLMGLGGLLGLSHWRFKRLSLPVVLAGGAFCVMLVRPQMWYEVYNQMAFMWLTLILPWLAVLMVEAGMERRGWRAFSGVRTAILLAVYLAGVLPMLKLCYGHGFITGPRHYPAKLGWGSGMQMDPAPYITEQDIRTVLAEIKRHVADDRKYRVFFMPEGDALFFHGRMPSNAVPYQGVRTRVRGDMAVFRLSRHPPAWWTEQYVRKWLAEYGGGGIAPFYGRDGTEQWILIPPGGRGCPAGGVVSVPARLAPEGSSPLN